MSKSLKKSHIFHQQEKLGKDMLTKDTHTLIKDLFQKGMAKKGIARFLGVDVKTVRRHLRKEFWEPYTRPESGDKLLSPFMNWLLNRIPEVDGNARILYRELSHQGYEGSYETVKKVVRPYRERSREKACMRFETSPGEQSQVDWGSAWVWLGIRQIKVHIFAMVLGYSRRLFGQGYEDETLASLIHGHEKAFSWFEGITLDILYDNPKTMVASHDLRTGEVKMNGQFKDFVSYYGFQARFCWPYRPQTKGKIESGVKYIKRNFLKGRRFESLAHFNQELEKWCLETADQRIHGTTHTKPAERFKSESLIPLIRAKPYVYHPAISRKVSRDARVKYKSNEYSVPWTYASQCVDLQVCGNELRILHGGKTLAIHPLLQGRFQSSIQKTHYAGLLRYGKNVEVQKMPQHDPYWLREDTVQVRDLSLYEQVANGGGAHAL